MIQSILNTFVFGHSFGGKNLTIFTNEGPPPFAENSTKIINSIFEPFPYHLTRSEVEFEFLVGGVGGNGGVKSYSYTTQLQFMLRLC